MNHPVMPPSNKPLNGSVQLSLSAAQQLDLLFKRELCHHGMCFGLDGGRIGSRRLRQNLRRGRKSATECDEQQKGAVNRQKRSG